MKRTFLTILIALIAPAVSRAVWPDRDYNEVRAYVFKPTGRQWPSIIENGKLDPSVIKKSGTRLTRDQVAQLVGALTGKHPMIPIAACFYPRHAFVFYNKDMVPVASVDISFECLTIRSKPEEIAFPYDLAAIAELCRELKLPDVPDEACEVPLIPRKSSEKRPNQPPLRMPVSGTPAADAPVAPPPGIAGR